MWSIIFGVYSLLKAFNCKEYAGQELVAIEPFPKRQILDHSKLKDFAEDNFMKMAKSSQNREKTLWEKEKLLVMSNFSFSHSVFKRLVSQGRQKVSLFGNGLIKTKNKLKGQFLSRIRSR